MLARGPLLSVLALALFAAVPCRLGHAARGDPSAEGGNVV